MENKREEIQKRKEEMLKEYKDKEKKRIQSEYEKVRKLLHDKPNGYNKPYVQRQIHEKPNLRRTYLALIKNTPARISEISEDALLTKPTCYSQLHHLLELHLVSRIFIMDVMNGAVQNDEIKEKFTNWTNSMPDQLKRYYLAKTSFWVLTDFGKEFVTKAWEFEQEFREYEDYSQGEDNDD